MGSRGWIRNRLMRGSGWGMICILLNECERERESPRTILAAWRGVVICMRRGKMGTGLRCGLQGSRKRWLRLDSSLFLGVLFSLLQDSVLFSESWGLRGNIVFLLGVYDIIRLIEKQYPFHFPTFPLKHTHSNSSATSTDFYN